MEYRLLFISHQTDRYSYLESIQLALRGGCKLIQLRMKGATDAEVREVAIEAKKECQLYEALLTIDDRVELGRELGLDGVHLGLSDLPIDKARALWSDEVLMGGTANTLDDMLMHQERGANYIGLGPFRFTSTKKRLSARLGLKGYRELLALAKAKRMRLPIYAIGGIQPKDIPALMAAGVWGIALSSTILEADDPVEQTKSILEIIKNCINE